MGPCGQRVFLGGDYYSVDWVRGQAQKTTLSPNLQINTSASQKQLMPERRNE